MNFQTLQAISCVFSKAEKDTEKDISAKGFADLVSQHVNATGKQDADLVRALEFLKKYKGENRSDWMRSLPKKITTMPLTEIAIPGSHDSFTVKLRHDWPIGATPDLDENVVKAVNAIHSITSNISVLPDVTIVQRIIYNWAVTQSLTLYDQLVAGIRYFDFRVTGEKEDIHLLHSLFADDTLSSFEQMERFLREHDKEVIIIDINHFYEMTSERHQELLRQIKSVFEGKLVPKQSYGRLTLENLWGNNQQVIILYHDEASSGEELVWSGSSITSHWPNTNVIGEALKKLNQWTKERRGEEGFWVSQGIVTATAKDIAPGSLGEIWRGINGGDWSSMKRELGLPMCKAVSNWVRGKKIGRGGVNIVIADFVEENDFIPNVIALNR